MEIKNLNKNIQFVWTQYGGSLAIGLRNKFNVVPVLAEPLPKPTMGTSFVEHGEARESNTIVDKIRLKNQDSCGDINLLEQIYNLFYNYGITGGDFYPMNDNKFGYFLIQKNNFGKIKKLAAKFPLWKVIHSAMKENFIEEDFLKEYKASNVVIVNETAKKNNVPIKLCYH